MKEKRKTSLELTTANRCERLLNALPYDARQRVLVYLRAMVEAAQPVDHVLCAQAKDCG